MEAIHNNRPKGTKCPNFTCPEVCCYGIDLSASILRINQSEHSIWTNESAPLWLLAALSWPPPSRTSNLQTPGWRNSNTPSGLARACWWFMRTTSTIYQTPPPPAPWSKSLIPAPALYSMGSLREFIMVTPTSHWYRQIRLNVLDKIIKRKNTLWVSPDFSKLILLSFDYSKVNRIQLLQTKSFGNHSHSDSPVEEQFFFFEKVNTNIV